MAMQSKRGSVRYMYDTLYGPGMETLYYPYGQSEAKRIMNLVNSEEDRLDRKLSFNELDGLLVRGGFLKKSRR